MTSAQLFDLQLPAPPKEKKLPAKIAYTGTFLEFWKLYPPRFNSSKFLAFKAWRKLDEDEQRQAMVAAPIYAKSVRGQEERFTYHAASWLNGKYFETIAAPVAPCQTINIDWPLVLRIYAKTNNWNLAYGPSPSQPGCKVPTELLERKP